MNAYGLLRIQVCRGINLAVRDVVSQTSDPYVIISHAGERVKTSAVKNNCSPVWNDNLSIPLKDLNVPIVLTVLDKDTISGDDALGDAEINVKPLLDCLKMGLEELPDGTKVDRVQPSQNNSLADESCIVWNKGKLSQNMILRLRNVESGEVEIQVEFLEFPGFKDYAG